MRYNPRLLLAAAAIAMARVSSLGAQTAIAPRPGYSVLHSDKPRQPRVDRLAQLARAAGKRSTRQRRNLRWAARGAIQLVNRS